MLAHRNCHSAIAALGILTAALGLSAFTVPTMLSSLGLVTFLVGLAITAAAIWLLAFSAGAQQKQDSTAELQNQLRQLLEQCDALRSAHGHLLEDKAFFQFLRADQDRERQLLALDLHDMALPNLTSALFHLEGLSRRGQLNDETLPQAIDMIRESLFQTRRVMNCLSPSLVHDEGVIGSLERLSEQLEQSIRTVTFRHDIDFDRLTPLSECAVVHLVREAFDLIRRHRQAQHVTLDFRQNDDHLVLQIMDDGTCDLLHEEEVAGRQRIDDCVELLHGHCELQCQEDIGTTLRVELSVTDLTQSDTLSEKSPAIG